MRLIDADEFIKEIAKIDDLRKISTKTIGEALERTPTIEAVPVVHAEWIDGCCTNCRAYMPTDSSIDFISEDECNYCYSCGAKMRTK